MKIFFHILSFNQIVELPNVSRSVIIYQKTFDVYLRTDYGPGWKRVCNDWSSDISQLNTSFCNTWPPTTHDKYVCVNFKTRIFMYVLNVVK